MISYDTYIAGSKIIKYDNLDFNQSFYIFYEKYKIIPPVYNLYERRTTLIYTHIFFFYQNIYN